MPTTSDSGRDLVSQFVSGAVSRRQFLQRALALGIAPALATSVAYRVAAQEATPTDADLFVSDGSPSAVGMENVTRGEGGELKIIQYQAPTSLSPHTSTGYKDYDAAQLILEPVLTYLTDGQLYGVLAAEVPTLENGLLSEDGLSVTFKLREGVVWSGGEPLTSADLKFTVEWVQDPANAATTKGTYDTIASVETPDDLTAVVTFNDPNPFWFEPFTGYVNGVVYPKHILEVEGAHDAFVTSPIGTGPYVLESFVPNDEARYVASETYREPSKPYFASVQLKGGGDGAAAARAVLQTGEFDFAWAPGVEPDVLNAMLGEDAVGILVPALPVNVERMAINHSDPNTEVDGQISEMHTPHPAFKDEAVRKAMALAIDRQLIADNFYGMGSTAAINVINGDVAVSSPNTEYVYDPAAAAAMLEEAGWALNGDIRAKDGVELSIVFASAISSRRQKTQAVVKAALEAIGFKVQLEAIDSGIFFDASAGNDQSFNKFPWDLMLYVSPQGGTRPLSYMEQWFTGTDGENIAQKSNDWTGSNNSRWQNPEYDALWLETRSQTDPEQLIANFIALNDMVVNATVLVPLVVVGGGSCASKRLRLENLIAGGFSGAYGNIANWNTV